MKVSSKIIAGFLILMLLGLVLVASQLSVIDRMQSVNRDLSEIDFESALAALEMQLLVETIAADSQRYIISSDHQIYDVLLADERKDFLDHLALLQRNARS